MTDIYSAALATVQFVWRPIWRYSKNQYQYKDNSEAFNARKEELRQLQETIQSKLNTELQTGRKIDRPDVVKWLTAAGEEVNKQSVEDQVSQRGCLLSCICRTRVLTTRTARLDQLLDQGGLLSILLDILSILDDVQLRLRAQLQDGGKIEKNVVKLWLRNVEEKTSPAATSFENQFANGPYNGDFPRRFRERKQQLEELLREGALLPESLVVDDYTQTLGDDEIKSFRGWKDKLQVKHRDVNEKLSTERRQNPEKIATAQVEQWRQKVDITIPAASDVHNRLNSRQPPYLASLVNRVKELIQEMKKLCDEGDQLPESLVIDDPSHTLSDDEMQKFKEWKEKLRGKYKDVERMLQSQHGFGKIEVEQVKIWRKQVEETIASATDVQIQLSSGHPPYHASLVNRVKELIQEMEELHDEGCKLPVSLVIDDPSASAPPMLTPELQGSDAVLKININICGEPGSIPSDVQRLKISSCNDVRTLNAISGFQDVFDLQEVVIESCREVEYVFSGLNQLSKLKRLELVYLDNLKGLFDSEAAPPPLAVFSSLEAISIRECPKIKKLFPTTLQYLPNLKHMSIRNCSQLEEIMVASSSEGAPPLVNFSSLETIFIAHCPKIKKLFPTTLQYLPNLEAITIVYCSQLEEIMVASLEEGGGRVILPKLEKLILEDLPMLRSISNLTEAHFKTLRISRCPNLDMEYVFRGQFKFNSLQTLESIVLEGLQSLKSIFHEEADESLAFGAPLSGTQTISLPLKELEVQNCPLLKNIFPHAVQLDSFKNLESIEVKRCDELVEIMAVSSDRKEDQSKTILPKLKILFLIELPVLRRICSALLVPDSLQLLRIEDCPNLSWECLFGLHADLPRTLRYLSLKGVRNLESVFDEEASDSLAFWRLPPAATASFALQRISVENCPQLKRIFTHAGLLGYLQNMWVFEVTGCDELEEIISSKSEEEPLKVTHLPELLVVFNLRSLPKLKRVCTGTSALICDSLEFLTISGCKELKRFPLHLAQSDNGQLSLPPNFRGIELSRSDVEWWESLEWDQPNAKNILAPYCILREVDGTTWRMTAQGQQEDKE